MKAWHVILLLIGLVASFFTGYHIRRTDAKNVQVKRDTVIDTLRTVLPIPSFEIELTMDIAIYTLSIGNTIFNMTSSITAISVIIRLLKPSAVA